MPIDIPPEANNFINKEKLEVAKDTSESAEKGDVMPFEKVGGSLSFELQKLKAENEKLRQATIQAANERDTVRAGFQAKVSYLKEIDKGDKKSLNNLVADIHTLTYQMLDSKKGSMDDENFRAKVSKELEKAISDAGNPLGSKLVGYAILLNQTDLGDDLKILSNAEWRVYEADYLYGKSEKQIKDFESVVKNSKSESSSDVASSK